MRKEEIIRVDEKVLREWEKMAQEKDKRHEAKRYELCGISPQDLQMLRETVDMLEERLNRIMALQEQLSAALLLLQSALEGELKGGGKNEKVDG